MHPSQVSEVTLPLRFAISLGCWTTIFASTKCTTKRLLDFDPGAYLLSTGVTSGLSATREFKHYRFSLAAHCDIFVCFLGFAFCEVNSGRSNVPALRKDRSRGACHCALRRYGVPALPSSAGSRQRKPDDRHGCRLGGRLDCLAGYARFDEYTRLCAAGFTFVSRVWHRLAVDLDVHCVFAQCAVCAGFRAGRCSRRPRTECARSCGGPSLSRYCAQVS